MKEGGGNEEVKEGERRKRSEIMRERDDNEVKETLRDDKEKFRYNKK